MSKFPHLDQLRADRQRTEDEIAHPYRHQLDGMLAVVRIQGEKIRGIETLFGTDIGDYMLRIIADQTSTKIQQLITQAASKVPHGPNDPITFTMDTGLLNWANPASLENAILRQYAREALPKLTISPMTVTEARINRYIVRIPELNYEHQQAEGI